MGVNVARSDVFVMVVTACKSQQKKGRHTGLVGFLTTVVLDLGTTVATCISLSTHRAIDQLSFPKDSHPSSTT